VTAPAATPAATVLRQIFDRIYMSSPAAFWRLSSLARSRETLRQAFVLSRGVAMPARLHPTVPAGEYLTLAAMAHVTDVEAVIADLHAQFAWHPYPASLFDPMHRMERWP
jgi:hypothetical protein